MKRDLLIQNGNVLIDDKLILADVLVLDGVFAKIKKGIKAEAGIPSYNAQRNLVLPGFIDVHTHGGVGVDMNNASGEDVKKVSEFFASQGVTGFLPTLLTDSQERLTQCIHTITEAKKTLSTGAKILGIHMEGPYLCKDYKGAMPESLLQLPSVEEFEEYQRVAEGNILRITVSPEVEGAPEFIEKVSKTGVAVSIGHSGADYDRAWRCIHGGAVSATHTFNAMKLMHQHYPAISGAILESDIYCEAICDGIHLHPGTVRILLKTKGYNRVVAVTDSIMAAGLGDGKYKLGVNDIVVTNGDAMLADGTSRAGSTLTMSRALRNLVQFTGKEPQELSCLLSQNPADMIGLGHRKGCIKEGMDADMVILNKSYHVLATFVEGVKMFDAQ